MFFLQSLCSFLASKVEQCYYLSLCFQSTLAIKEDYIKIHKTVSSGIDGVFLTKSMFFLVSSVKQCYDLSLFFSLIVDIFHIILSTCSVSFVRGKEL